MQSSRAASATVRNVDRCGGSAAPGRTSLARRWRSRSAGFRSLWNSVTWTPGIGGNGRLPCPLRPPMWAPAAPRSTRALTTTRDRPDCRDASQGEEPRYEPRYTPMHQDLEAGSVSFCAMKVAVNRAARRRPWRLAASHALSLLIHLDQQDGRATPSCTSAPSLNSCSMTLQAQSSAA